MKFSRGAARKKFRGARVSVQRLDVRTPHVPRGARNFPTITTDKFQKQRRPVWAADIFEIAVWSLEFRTLRFLTSAFTGVIADWLCPRARRAVEVCDALPQRNCGRFSRPSPMLRTNERTANPARLPIHRRPAITFCAHFLATTGHSLCLPHRPGRHHHGETHFVSRLTAGV